VQRGVEVWETWDALLADRRMRFVDESVGFEAEFRLLSAAFGRQPKRWQDAYLATFALTIDLELVTFDTGFRSFPNLRHHILEPEMPPE